MKENDVAQISEQFGLSKEIVEASVNDGTLSQRISDSIKNNFVLYKKDEFEGFKRNHALEVQDGYFKELVEKAKKQDLPSELYAPVKGAAYQQLERELSKRFDITEYKDVTDLVDKAVKRTSASGKPTDLEQKIAELQQANLALTEEKNNAVKDVEQRYKERYINEKKSAILDNVPFDFSDVKPDEVGQRKAKTQNILKSVFEQEYTLDIDEQNRVIVKNKEGKVMKNQATLEPTPAQDVFVSLAKEYNIKLTSPDSGGQGGKSSHKSNAAFSDFDSFQKWAADNNIKVNSAEYIKAWKDSGLKQ